MNNQQQELLEIAQQYLQQEIAPKANQIDRQSDKLRVALQGLGKRNLLALRVPENLGGAGFSEIEYRQFQIAIASTSGALAFLQTQHQSAGSFLVASENQFLQQQYLPQMSKGKILIGVGFSQLRRRGKPMMQAREVEGGYLLDGEVPWITGFDFFDQFIIGAALPDGRELYGLLPLQTQTQDTSGTILLSQPMELIATTATNTVSGKIKQWFLPDQQVVSIKPPNSIHEGSKKNILHHGFFAMGCAYAALNLLKQIYQKKQLAFLEQSWQQLDRELTICKKKTFQVITQSNSSDQEKLQLRAWAINLAGRCSQAAIIATSGAANYLNSSAGRIYREALLFSVSGQTTDVMAESLKQLL
ncbi:acyl-CoA dehydrogenase family protein [Stanieria cyanosphaera]|nr:acyl-CoA dehydrogenase family protein [Stanieria cyanosphaera]